MRAAAGSWGARAWEPGELGSPGLGSRGTRLRAKGPGGTGGQGNVYCVICIDKYNLFVINSIVNDDVPGG